MDSEPTNLPSGGSDNARPSDDLSKSLNLDDAASLNIDFGDEEDEDQGAEPNAPDTDPESETDEPDDGQEADAEDDDEDQGETSKAEIAASITLSDGTKLSLDEVEKGFMRERDYRHKTQELGNQKRTVADLQARLEKVSETVVDFLAKALPPSPDPALMVTDPLRHYQEMQAHQSGMQQVQALLEQANATKDVGQVLTAEQHQESVSRERAALLEKLPHLRDPAKMDKFAQSLAPFAVQMGFTNEELAGLTDHRQIMALHYAMRGMEAEKAKQTVKAKVANAPPVSTPQKAAKQVTADSTRQQQLRERFRKSGSIHDAAKLDWA